MDMHSIVPSCYSLLSDLLDVRQRVGNILQWYIGLGVLISLALYSSGDSNNERSLMGVKPKQWLRFMIALVLTEVLSCCVDHTFFVLLERAWCGSYKVLFYISTLKGPLGHFMTLCVMSNVLYTMSLPRSLANWRALITTAACVLLLYSLKSLMQRRHYALLLEVRFRSRVEVIYRYQKILSLLCSVNSSASFYSTENDSATSDRSNKSIGSESSSNEMGFWARVQEIRAQGLQVDGVPILSRQQAVALGRFIFTRLLGFSQYDSAANRLTVDSLLTMLPDDLQTQAGELFGFSPGSSYTESVTEDMLVSGAVEAYKTARYASASLSDLRSLHQSVLSIVDAVFWVLMLLLAQIILQLESTQRLAPLLTVIFGLSFALGPSFGSLCLSVVYVMVMLPYDIGNRVIVCGDSGRGDDVIGNVSAISLAYTTIVTKYNEKMKFPNHILFNKRVINLHESPGATLEVSISLSSSGTEEAYDQVWREVEEYVRVKKRCDWSDVNIYATGVDTLNNCINYSLWITHRSPWNETKRIYSGRSYVIAALRRAVLRAGLKVVKISQPLTGDIACTLNE
mmetsp:Transcript_1823/g.2880  ORF Transcript_1823/g.2880 Transcript_1823/m.2880 type:complete len:569 (-) Transcript_1823:122-1828(-)